MSYGYCVSFVHTYTLWHLRFTYTSAVSLQRVTHFLDRLEQVAGAKRRGVVHAGSSTARAVVAREAAVAVLRLPVIFFLLIVVTVVCNLGWSLLRLARLSLGDIRLGL